LRSWRRNSGSSSGADIRLVRAGPARPPGRLKPRVRAPPESSRPQINQIAAPIPGSSRIAITQATLGSHRMADSGVNKQSIIP
jgi:hypothetical protein